MNEAMKKRENAIAAAIRPSACRGGRRARRRAGGPRLAAAALLLVLGLSACGGSQTVDAPTAYARGEYAEAQRQWRNKAESGDPEAQYALGYMYRNGQGVPANSVEAFKWYQRAANQGLAKAQVKLGLMYAKGDGVERNLILAHAWFDLAARQGDEKAAMARDLIAKDMSPAQVAEARKLAQELVKR